MKYILFLGLIFLCLFLQIGTIDNLDPYYDSNHLDVTEQNYEENDAVETVSYDWQYGGYNWHYDFPIEMKYINFYESQYRDPSFYDDLYVEYVNDPTDDQYIKDISQIFIDEVARIGWDKSRVVNVAISFVQSLDYIAEEGEIEYPKYPLETIHDGGGDCEDSSILLVSILKEMGYGCCLIGFDEHVAVGILSQDIYGTYYEVDGKQYYYVETTNTGWEIGQMPDEYHNLNARIVVID